MKDANETFLDIGSVDVVGVLQEEVDPSREVDSVVLVSDGYFLKQFVGAFKNLRNLVSDGSVFGRFVVTLDFFKRFIQDEKNLNQEFSDACFDKNLLNG